MRQQSYGGPKLPRELLDQLGASGGSHRNGRNRGGPAGRKERRKLERQQKKTQKPPQRRHPKNLNRPQPQDDSESEDDEDGVFSPPPAKVPKHDPDAKPAKSILKLTEPSEGSESKNTKSKEKDSKKKEKKESKQKRSPSPSPAPAISRAVKDRLTNDDAEIAALEKKLGIKNKKKLPKSFEDDGLDDLLEGLDDELDYAVTGKRKRKNAEDEAWLERKRRKAGGMPIEEESESDEDSDMEELVDDDDESLGSDAEAGDLEDESEDANDTEEDEEEEDGFSGFSEGEGEDEDLDDSEGFDDEDDEGDEETSDEEEAPRVRENPYVAPVAANSAPAAKYVPPSMRGPPSSDAEAMTRLRRQTQGLLNRLSEANLLTILKDIEQLYQNNARQYVTSTLIDLLMGLICDRTSLQDTFLILHAGFIAAVYKVIGTDFGAQLIERVVAGFDNAYNDRDAIEAGSKVTSNVMSLVAEMYNFQVVGSNLVFDYIRMFLDELSELNTELLLRIIKMSGSQLRQDDPTSLKDIVILLQKSVARRGEANLSVRTKFMIETINNLKNNRMKTGAAASAITSEHTIRMKKTLGSLNTRNLKGSEPLRIGLQDLRDTEKKGKWWLVGASWKNEVQGKQSTEETHTKSKKERGSVDAEEIIESGTTDLLQLAKEQRMNTDIRRAIFITIMSASDYKDAHLRLLKLRLKKAQELEIPRVLIHCGGAEQSYNPYYTIIARRLCSEKKLRMAFQFSLWDLFKRMGEKDDADNADFEEEEGEEALTTRKIVNLAKMFGTLIAEDGLPITVLKPKTEAFVEVLLATVILRSQKQTKDHRDEKALLDVAMKTKDAPQMARGLQYFLDKVVSKGDVGGSKSERETVRWGCRVAVDALTVLATQRIEEEE